MDKPSWMTWRVRLHEIRSDFLIAVWIVLGIFGFFAILLCFSFTIYIKITDEVFLSLGAFGYKKAIKFGLEDKEQSSKPKSQKKPTKAQSATKKVTQKKATQKSLSQTLDFAITLMKSIVPQSVKMLKHIRFHKLKLHMTVADDDADQTAINYGRVSTAVYTLLGVLDNSFKLSIKSVDIQPDFVTGEAEYDISFCVKLRFIHIIGGAIGMICKIVVNTIKHKKNEEV